MCKKILIILLVVMWSVPAIADMVVETAWVNRYTTESGMFTERAFSLALDISGNLYVTGGSEGTNHRLDWVTIKYAADGSELWFDRWEGTEDGHDCPYALQLDESGNVCVTGDTWGGTTYVDCATVKYDSAGNEIWARTYNAPLDSFDGACDIAIDGAGNVCVTGKSQGVRTGWDYLTIKYLPNGLPTWVRRYDAGGDEEARAVAADDYGNVYVTGSHGTIKYDSLGNQLWVREGSRKAIVLDEVGNVHVTGSWTTTKYDSEGNEFWTKELAGGTDLAVDADGNVYVTAGGPDYTTVKYYPNGDTAWVRRYVGPLQDQPYAITLDDSSNIYVTGTGFVEYCREDYVTVKYDPEGNHLWLQRYNGPGCRTDIPYAIAVAQSGHVFVTGRSHGAGTGDDFATIKYVQTDAWRGDANRNEAVDGGDIVFLINYLYKNGPTPDPFGAGDSNCDDGVNVDDVVYLVNYLFREGPEPACF